MKKIHGNSHENSALYHLYVIKDKINNDVVKYGISAGIIDSNGLSYRVKKQLKLYNALVGWERFTSEILVQNIQGRKKAEQLETKYIELYKSEKGHKPRANLK